MKRLACNCGAPYLGAGQRAAEAIAANPERSDRSIAAELGIGNKTVSRARQAMGNDTPSRDTPDRVTGKDGKSYPSRTRAKPRTGVSMPSPSLTPPEPSNAPVDSPDSLPPVTPETVTPMAVTLDAVTLEDIEADIDARRALDLRRAMLRGDHFE